MTASDCEPVPVLIVGACPADLAAAIDLAAQGLAPLVLERSPGPLQPPAGDSADHPDHAADEPLGIEAQVRASGFCARHAMSVRACLAGGRAKTPLQARGKDP